MNEQPPELIKPKTIVVTSTKSVGMSIFLTILFGPLGMLYSTVRGAIIMMIASIVLGAVTFGLGLLIAWPISIIWGARATKSYNQNLLQTVGMMALCFVFFTGCYSMPDQGQKFNTDNIPKLKVGESTEKDVVELIGKPVSRTRSADGSIMMVYQYVHSSGTANAMNPFDMGRNIKRNSKMLTVMIGSNGKLKDYSESGSE